MMLSGIRLRVIRLKEEKKFNEKNLWLYKNITSYIQSSNLTINEKEEVLQQIMDMMLQAQFENKSIDLFIGKDYEEFCNSIIEELNSSKSKTYKVFNYIQKYLVGMILIVFIMGISNLFNGDSSILSITVDQFILANAIALFIMPVLRISKQGDTDIFPYYPLYGKIKYKNTIMNNKSILVPISIYIIAIFMVKFIIKKFLGSDVMGYSINLYNNIYFIFLALIAAGTIEIYKKLCERCGSK
ncbi:hypothetical protein KQI89_06950 [Clostridium sp. MSJ-4]|uniref:DUF1048 domain-containing protein n=1 Tax=Clostridium simiarum TaxID=2841506 RepID=A0ABS6EZ38_9CLOT|nr:hypothetical protein [Clostridium simiarum]MBU5591497.1 hypothetical protein [Clostridium simiarum]